MDKLELIEITGGENKDKWYWYIDEEGIYLNSIAYDTRIDALNALVMQNIKWDMVGR